MLIKKGNLEVSVGKAVGHILEDHLISAKKRLWIISPWISPEYADLALKKSEEGVDVQIVTTNDYGNNKHRQSLTKLFEEKMETFQEGRLGFKVMAIILTFFGLLLAGAISSIMIVILIIVPFIYRSKITRTRYYCVPKIGEDKMIVYDRYNRFTHSKFYIIDNIGAVGSANLTRSGLWKNVEVLVIMKDKKIVFKLGETFQTLKTHPMMKRISSEDIGWNIFSSLQKS